MANQINAQSSPNGVVTGNTGDTFYRDGNDFYVDRISGGSTKLTFPPSAYLGKYRTPFYKNQPVFFATPSETWIKMTGTGKTGWKYFSSVGAIAAEPVIQPPPPVINSSFFVTITGDPTEIYTLIDTTTHAFAVKEVGGLDEPTIYIGGEVVIAVNADSVYEIWSCLSDVDYSRDGFFTDFELSNNLNITALSITGTHSSVSAFYCYASGITSIDVSMLSSASYIALPNNTSLSSIVLPSNSNTLTAVTAHSTRISSLNSSGNNNLSQLYINNTQVTDFSNIQVNKNSMAEIQANYLSASFLDFTGYNSLITLDVGYSTYLTKVGFPTASAIDELYVRESPTPLLDVSSVGTVTYLYLSPTTSSTVILPSTNAVQAEVGLEANYQENFITASIQFRGSVSNYLRCSTYIYADIDLTTATSGSVINNINITSGATLGSISFPPKGTIQINNITFGQANSYATQQILDDILMYFSGSNGTGRELALEVTNGIHPSSNMSPVIDAMRADGWTISINPSPPTAISTLFGLVNDTSSINITTPRSLALGTDGRIGFVITGSGWANPIEAYASYYKPSAPETEFTGSLPTFLGGNYPVNFDEVGAWTVIGHAKLSYNGAPETWETGHIITVNVS